VGNEKLRRIECNFKQIFNLCVTSGSGMILDKAEQRFSRLPLFQPVINGVGGNLVSIQASRISTTLHRDCTPGQLPGTLPGASSPVFMSPYKVFFKNGMMKDKKAVFNLSLTVGIRGWKFD